MTNYVITEINCETGQVIEREMTDSEKKQRELDNAIYEENKKAKAETETKRQAVLDRLGITEEEARLLLS